MNFCRDDLHGRLMVLTFVETTYMGVSWFWPL